MNTFTLKVIACNRVFYEGPCEILIYPAFDGQMAIMANHESITSCIDVGEIHFRTPDGVNHVAIVSDGLIKVDNNKADVFVYSAEKPEEIDKFRAEAALERAKDQLRQKQSIMEYNVSSASLARAMARLRGIENFDIH